MRQATFLAILLLSSSLSLACHHESKSEEASSTTTVTGTELSAEQLGELGARINKNPGDAAKLLAEKGLTEETFEKAIRKVTESQEASQRYAAAFRETEQKL